MVMQILIAFISNTLQHDKNCLHLGALKIRLLNLHIQSDKEMDKKEKKSPIATRRSVRGEAR